MFEIYHIPARGECVGIVLKGFGEEGRGTRFSKTWACGLLAARKVKCWTGHF